MTPRDRGALLAMAAIAVAIMALRVVPWTIHAIANLQETAQQRTETLMRARDAIARAPAERDSLTQAFGSIVRLAPKLVPGTSAADAQASLSGIVSHAAGRHSVKVHRVQPVADSANGVFQPVVVFLEGEADITGLASLVRTIERAEQVLTIRTLVVQAPDPESRPELPERLRIELLVAGLYLPRPER